MAASMAQDGTTLMARKGRLCVASEMWEDKASTDGTRSFTGREWRAYLELERTGAMWTIVGVAPGWIAVAATRRGDPAGIIPVSQKAAANLRVGGQLAGWLVFTVAMTRASGEPGRALRATNDAEPPRCTGAHGCKGTGLHRDIDEHSCGMCVLGRVKPRRLQIMSLTRRHKRNCETRTRPYAVHNPKLKRGKMAQDKICWFYNTSTCTITTCKWKHECGMCGDGHPGYKCTKHGRGPVDGPGTRTGSAGSTTPVPATSPRASESTSAAADLGSWRKNFEAVFGDTRSTSAPSTGGGQ